MNFLSNSALRSISLDSGCNVLRLVCDLSGKVPRLQPSTSYSNLNLSAFVSLQGRHTVMPAQLSIAESLLFPIPY